MTPSVPATGKRRIALLVAGGLAALLVFVVLARAVPLLPANPDLYLHLVWAHQVMRCLADGALPLWFPDLNAGFGSPGIRLGSPLGPVLDGTLGLALGDAASGLRLGALLAGVCVVAVCSRGRRWNAFAPAVLLLLSPAALHALFGRSAWAEVLALPLVVWLLDAAVAGWRHPVRDAAGLAALWLLHAPSTAVVLGVALLAQALRRDRRALTAVAASAVGAAGLTAWHWLPLLNEASFVGARTALTGGIYRAARNVLGSPEAHALDTNIALGWCAVAILLALLVSRAWRTEPVRTALVVLLVAGASSLALPLWRLPGPQALLQFPWRLLLPATVLAVPPIVAALGDWFGRLAVPVLLLPAVLLPRPSLVRAPALTADTGWRQAGAAIHDALGGNPLLVDAEQDRPPAFAMLATNLKDFGDAPVKDFTGQAVWRVTRWAPLQREVEVRAWSAAVIDLRLLAYPGWELTVDGERRAAATDRGVLGVAVPAGEHRVAARWRGNPLAPVGLALAAATAALLLMAVRRGARKSEDGR